MNNGIRMQKATGNHCIKDPLDFQVVLRTALQLSVKMEKGLGVKFSGVIPPQSDLREGETKRQNLESRKGRKWRMKKKSKLRIGTWNVLTLLQSGKLENVKREMTTNNIDILGMSEVRWGGNGEIESGEYKLFYSGEDKNGRNGVGLMMKNSIEKRVIKIEYTNERIIWIRLKGVNKDLVIIQVYMPTSQYQEEELEQYYEKIEDIIEREKRNACIIVMGDWNAVVGEGEENKEVGKYGLGKRNERGERLVNFCKENSMTIGNTLCESHKRRRYSGHPE